MSIFLIQWGKVQQQKGKRRERIEVVARWKGRIKTGEGPTYLCAVTMMREGGFIENTGERGRIS